MKFIMRQKMYRKKQKLLAFIGGIIVTISSPFIGVYVVYNKFKYKQFKNRVNRLSIYDASCLMARHIFKELAERPKLEYELYVCDSEYHSDADPTTVIDHVLYDLPYSKGKYYILYKWAWDMHYNRKLNGVWLNEVMAEIIHNELYNIKGLDVHWEYDEEIAKSAIGKRDYPNYQKHLIIRVK